MYCATVAVPTAGRLAAPLVIFFWNEIRSYDETAREPLRCYCSSVECESELVGQQDYRASSRAGVSGFGAATFAHPPQRARRRRRRALLHLQARDDSRPTVLVLLSAGGVEDVGCSCGLLVGGA
jgi:hypothetical protein